MKIFAYNPETKQRGTEVLGERSVCSGHGRGTMFSKGNEDWVVLDTPSAVDSQRRPITAEQYGQQAICFCIGEMHCGTDVAWNWVVVKAKENI